METSKANQTDQAAMKLSIVSSALLCLLDSGIVSADVFAISKCICASDNFLGFHAAVHIKGPTTGFGDTAGRYDLHSDVLRDDFSYPKKQGLLCDPDSRSNCKRVPDISQYYNFNEMVPKGVGQNCFMLDNKSICSSINFLTINGVAKALPGTLVKQVGSDECTEQCARLWPDDNSTIPLCSITSLQDSNSAWYKKRILVGNRHREWDVDRCWTYQTPEFDFNKLERP